VALLLFSNAHSPLRQWLIANEVAETGDEIPVACVTIAQQYKLSPREQEVLSLLARGRNASYVARSLCISPDTAKTHIKSIYRKVDVHTQQGLIDEIEKAIRE
ncbi:MAG: helix-turn-helix transcriptional regulator, partial [Raoultibacter sp.]